MEDAKLIGDRAFEKKEYSEAAWLYSEALKLPAPSRPDIIARIHANLSATYAHTKQSDQALAQADKAISMDPAYARAHQRRGNALEQLKRFGAAAEHTEKV